MNLDLFGPVIRHRRALARSRATLARGSLSIGFLGGSITAPKTGTRWPEPFAGWFMQHFPVAQITIENAAIGATGSDLAAFRVQPEIIARGCDLVFVEYAVNDVGTPTARRNRTREGVLRQLATSGADIVLVYTFCPEMLPDLEAGRVPPSIAEFEALAEHYGIGSVWMGLHALREVQQGLMAWPEWLPDGLHPEQRGSLSYAQSVIAFCAAEWDDVAAGAVWVGRSALPPALHAGCWESVAPLDLARADRSGAWTLRRWFGCLGMDRALHSSAPGARLRIPFEGRGLLLGFDFGRLSSEVSYRVDEGEWTVTQRDRPAWCGDSGWYRPVLVADDLAPGAHVCELETLAVAVPGASGTLTTLGLIGVIR